MIENENNMYEEKENINYEQTESKKEKKTKIIIIILILLAIIISAIAIGVCVFSKNSKNTEHENLASVIVRVLFKKKGASENDSSNVDKNTDVTINSENNSTQNSNETNEVNNSYTSNTNSSTNSSSSSNSTSSSSNTNSNGSSNNANSSSNNTNSSGINISNINNNQGNNNNSNSTNNSDGTNNANSSSNNGNNGSTNSTNNGENGSNAGNGSSNANNGENGSNAGNGSSNVNNGGNGSNTGNNSGSGNNNGSNTENNGNQGSNAGNNGNQGSNAGNNGNQGSNAGNNSNQGSNAGDNSNQGSNTENNGNQGSNAGDNGNQGSNTGSGSQNKPQSIQVKIEFKSINSNKEMEKVTETVKTSGNEIGILPTPTKVQGYTFIGWYTEENGGTKISNKTIVPKNNVTYYAHWFENVASITIDNSTMYYPSVQEAIDAAKTHDVTIKLEKEEVVESIKISEGQNITLDLDGKTLKSENETAITNNGTLTLKENGGKIEATDGKCIEGNKPNTPDGFTVREEIVDGKVSVTIGNTYTVTLNNKCEGLQTPTSIIATYNEDMPNVKLPIKIGYTFDGYYAEENGKGKQYYTNKGTSAAKWDIASDTTLYANWIPNTYTIQYHGNGSEGGDTASSTHIYDEEKTLTENGFTKTGYTFTEWNTKPEGTGTSYENNANVTNLGKVNNETVNLYAIWTPNELIFNNEEKKITYNTSSQTIEIKGASNGTGIYTYSIISQPNENYFAIGGTTITAKPSTKVGTYELVVKAVDNNSKVTKNATITVTVEKQKTSTPQDLEINAEGIVTWKEVENATGYEISTSPDGEFKPATNGMDYNSEITKEAGTKTIYVRAVNSDTLNYETSENMAKEVTVYNLTVNKEEGIKEALGAGNYISGKQVTISAEAKTGYTWSNWEITPQESTIEDNTKQSTKVTVKSETTVTAIATANELVFNGKEKNLTYSTNSQTIKIEGASNGTGTYTYEITQEKDLENTNTSYFKIEDTTITAKECTKAGTYELTVKAKDTNSKVTKDATFTIKVEKQKVNTPENLAIDADGIVTWDNVENATGYEIKINEDGEFKPAENGIDFNSVITQDVGTKTIYVRAVNSDTANYITSESIEKQVTVYELTVNKETGIDEVIGTGKYISGKIVPINATAKTGYTWNNWTILSDESEEKETNPIANTTITVNGKTTVTANATANQLIFSNQESNIIYSTNSQTIEIEGASNGTGTYTYKEKLEANVDGVVTDYFTINDRIITVKENTPAGKYFYVITATDSNSKVMKDTAITINIAKQKVKTPRSLEVNEEGIVTWEEVENATGYEISINNIAFTTATSGIDYNSVITSQAGTRTVYVRAINRDTANYETSENVIKEITVYDLTVNKLEGINVVTGTGKYISGRQIPITAEAKVGYTWSKWEVSENGSVPDNIKDAKTNVTVDAKTIVTATATANELIFNNQEKNIIYNANTQITDIEGASNGTGNYTYSIISQPEGNYFIINERTITVKAGTNVGSYELTVRATDNESRVIKDITVKINIAKQKVKTPENLQVTLEGIVTWEQVNNATGYEISIDNNTFTSAVSGIDYNGTITEETRTRTVYVRAINSDTLNYETSENTTKELTVCELTVNKGEGIKVASGSGKYISGRKVAISAEAKTGYTWSRWAVDTGSIPSNVNNKETQVTVNVKTTLTATATANELIFNGGDKSLTYNTGVQVMEFTGASNGTGTYMYTEKSETNASGTKTSYFTTSGTTIIAKAGAPAGTYTYVVTASDTESKVTKDATFTIKVAKQKVNPVTNLQVSTDGKVTWIASNNATGYEISIDNSSFTGAASGMDYNSTITAQSGKRIVYVRAINSDAANYETSVNTTKEVTVYDLTVNKGTGISAVSGTGKYISGRNVDISAQIEIGYTWSKWTVSTGGSTPANVNNILTKVTVNAQTTLTATATANQLTFNGKEANLTYNTSSQTISITPASNGTGTYTYAEKSEKNSGGAATAYFTINGTTITAKEKTPAGTYTYVVTATDSNSKVTKDATFTIKVAKQKVNAVTNLQVGTDGRVTWTASSNATGYQISIDNNSYTNASSGVDYNSTITAQAGTRVVYVRAINSDTANYETSLNATKEVTVYQLTVNKGTGINTVTGTGKYISGKQVTITAEAKTGYQWSKWTVSTGGSTPANVNNASTTVTVNKETTLTATASVTAYTISYTMNSGTNNSNNPTSYNIETDTITLKDPTRTGYTFTGWTGSNGTTAQKGVTIPRGSTGNKSYTANWTPNTVTVAIKENDENATTTGYYVSLSTSNTSDTKTKTATSTEGSVSFSAVSNGTYYIWAGKSSEAKTTSLYSGVSVKVDNNSPQTEINYYGLTLTKSAGIDTVINGGITTISEIKYLYNSSNAQEIEIDATVLAGYTWNTWSRRSGINLATFTPNTKKQTVKMGAGKTELMAAGVANTITVAIKENGSKAATTGYSISLSTSDEEDTETRRVTSSSLSQVSFSGVSNGTYYIWAGKNSSTLGKTSRIYSGVSIRVNDNSQETEINYYGLKLQYETGINRVTNGISYTTQEVEFLYNASNVQEITINAEVEAEYCWKEWKLTDGAIPINFKPELQEQKIKLQKYKTTLTANAVEAQAKINNTYYKTLQDAINAAPISTSTEITLIKDVKYTEPVTIAENQYITLDLGGHKIESSVITESAIYVNNPITTIIKNGTIKYSGQKSVIEFETQYNRELKLENVNITSTDVSSIGVTLKGNGTKRSLTIIDGSIEAPLCIFNDSQGSIITCDTENTDAATYYPKLTSTTKNYAIVSTLECNVNLYSGEVRGNLSLFNGTLTFGSTSRNNDIYKPYIYNEKEFPIMFTIGKLIFNSGSIWWPEAEGDVYTNLLSKIEIRSGYTLHEASAMNMNYIELQRN